MESQELNREFKRKLRKQYLFVVTRTPCIYHIENFMFFARDLQGDNLAKALKDDKQISYYHNKLIVMNFGSQMLLYCRMLTLVSDLIYFLVAYFKAEGDKP